MFWGLIMEPQKRYTQNINKSFHISMACLDVTTSTDELVQLMCAYEDRKYLICTLQQDKVIQCPLDLNFEEGKTVSFITNGNAHVHLSGYLIHDMDESPFSGDEEDDDENDADISLGNVSASNIVSGKRAKPGKNDGLNGLSAKVKEKLVALSENAPPSKKLKTMDLLQDINEDEDDEDDSDVDLDELITESDDDIDDTMDDIDDEEDDEEDDDEECEEEEDDDDEDDEQGEEEEEDEDDICYDFPPQQNGTAKKSKKEKLAEKQKAQQEAKQPKSKKENVKAEQQQAKSPKKTIEAGVQIEEIRVGSGAVAKTGKSVAVFYEGRFKSNNKVFDSHSKGNGFKFRLGRGEVIKGWDVGVAGMRIGGKRRLTCPPHAAYGAKGMPPSIPPNSTLVFDVELKSVN